MEPCTQRERIKRLKGAVDRIGGEVSQIASDVSVIKAKIELVFDMGQSHERALRGTNGDVGLTAKVTSAAQAMDEFTVALQRDKGEPGLIADIYTMKKWMGELKEERVWLTRLVIGIVVAEVGGLLFVLLI
jgi:hypothetical protein